MLAVIGGGQLARMMAQPAIALGLPLRLLAEAEGVSAAQVIPDHVVGDYRDLDDAAGLVDGCAVVTFDHEHVPTAHLRALERRRGRGPSRPGRPGARAGQGRDAGAAHRARRALPAARGPSPSPAEVADFGFPAVLKTTRGRVRRQGRVDGAVRRRVRAGLRGRRGGRRRGDPAEELVDFRRELSALVARAPSGQAAAYPVVADTQIDGICREVVAPAPDLDPALAGQAQEIALRVAGALDVTGILAVELFETTDGRILVNELAMRPHNTGPLDPGRRGDVAVREPPAGGARPAARLAGRRGRPGR